MSRKQTKLPPTGGWRAPNGAMAPMEPAKFAPVELDTGVSVLCARCRKPRPFGKACFDCETKGQP